MYAGLSLHVMQAKQNNRTLKTIIKIHVMRQHSLTGKLPITQRSCDPRKNTFWCRSLALINRSIENLQGLANPFQARSVDTVRRNRGLGEEVPELIQGRLEEVQAQIQVLMVVVVAAAVEHFPYV